VKDLFEAAAGMDQPLADPGHLAVLGGEELLLEIRPAGEDHQLVGEKP